MRYYNRVESTIDLHKLDEEARKESKKCVGVSRKGDLYTVDPGKNHRKITVAEAAEILETTAEEVQKLLEARGEYQIVDPEPVSPVIEPTPEQKSDPEPAVGFEEEIPEIDYVPMDPITEAPLEEEQKPAVKHTVEDCIPETDKVIQAAEMIAKAVGEVLTEHQSNNDNKLARIEEKIDDIKTSIDNLKEIIENFYL